MIIGFRKWLSLNEMAALAGRGSDPNADEQAIVDILNRIHNHPNETERKKFITHPQGVMHYVNTHMKTGDSEYDKGTSIAGNAAQQILNHTSKNHGSVRDLFLKKKAIITRSGITKAKVRPEYSNLGGKDATSRADIAVTSSDGKANHTFSVKKGDAQVASAESGEFRSLLHHSIDQYTNDEKVKSDLKNRVDTIHNIMKASETAKTDDEYRNHAKRANDILQSMRKEHPELENHIAREASTGHAKFGHGEEGSADNMLSYNDKTGEAKIWSSEEDNSPYKNGLKMEIRSGKGRKGKRDPNAPPGVDNRPRRQIAFRAEPYRPKKMTQV